MIGNNFWMWFVAGLIPGYFEQKTEASGEKTLIIAALFWSFEASSHYDGSHHRALHIRIPLIGQLGSKLLSSIIGTAIVQWQKKQIPPQQ